jgi:mannosylglycerate hydrolase
MAERESSPLPPGPWRFYLVPHTHWDREWYLPVEESRARFAHLVDEVIDVLETEPRMRFALDGQSVLLEDYLEYRPGAVRQGGLRRLLESGRLTAGPAYVLQDSFLVGQESLIRNLLMGHAVCRRFGAEPAPIGYAPDTFGHPAQMPQLLRGFGLDHFIFMRGLGNEGDELGAVFWWEGPDGSRVLAVRTLGGYGNASSLGHETSWGDQSQDPDAIGERAEWRLLDLFAHWGDAAERSALRDILLCNGVDHRRIQRDLPEVLTITAERLPDTSFVITDFGEYLDALRGRLAELTLGVRRGEMVGGRFHTVTRGVNSARMPLKQENERCERELQETETLASLATMVSNYRYPFEELQVAWRELLRNQPHDSIGGCSVDRVHRDMLQRYSSCRELAGRLRREALAAMTGLGHEARWSAAAEPEGGLRSAVNPLPFARRRVLTVGLPAVQRSARAPGYGFVPVTVAGFGSAVLEAAAEVEEPVRLVDERTLSNGILRIEVNDDATLAIDDLRSGRRYEGLHVFEDVAEIGDSYNHCPLPGPPWTSAGVVGRVRVRESGPVRGELEVGLTLRLPARLSADRSRRVGRVACPVRTIVRLDAGADRVELDTTLDNRARDHRLRALFAAPDADPARVRAEGHFGVVTRSASVSEDTSRWKEPPQPGRHFHGGVAAGSVNLLAQGLPEYEAIERPHGVELALTLVRSFGWLSRDDFPARPFGAGPQLATPEGQCLGPLELRYALSFGERSDAELVRAAHDFRFGLPCGSGRIALDGALIVEGDGVACSALKRAEDGNGLILRLYNPGADPLAVRVGGAIDGVIRTRMDEHGTEHVPEGELTLGGHEVATLRIWPAADSPLRHPDPDPTPPGAQPTLPV